MKASIRIIAFLGLLLSFTPSFSQDTGFFRIYERDDKEFRSCRGVVELDDGSFVVAANDTIVIITYTDYGDTIITHRFDLDAEGELIKVSAEGELLGSVPVSEADGYCKILNIFPHPSVHGLFVGLGFVTLADGFFNCWPPEWYGHLCLFHFDGDLNITERINPNWPDGLQTPKVCDYSVNNSMIRADGSIFSVPVFYQTSNNERHRFFTLFSPEGDIERIVEDNTVPDQPCVETVFEATDRSLWFVRNVQWHPYQDSHTLFRLDKNMQAEAVNEFHNFAYDSVLYYNNETGQWVMDKYHINLPNRIRAAFPMDDSTLLFSTVCDEHFYRSTFDTNLFVNDRSTVLFKTDIEGNILQHRVLGSLNDTVEEAPFYPTALSHDGPAGQNHVYHCHSTEHESHLEYPNHLVVTKLTEDLDIVWSKKYERTNTFLKPFYVTATSDGGCIVVGYAKRDVQVYPPSYGHNEIFVLKLLPDGTVGSGEITVCDEMAVYPNPAKNEVRLLTPPDKKPAQIELYDLQGRLVRSQGSGLERLSLQGLAPGQYVMKVTMTDGTTFSDKVVKE